jgi:hypothetical protein
VPGLDGPGQLEEPVGQCRLSVVYVRNYAEISNPGRVQWKSPPGSYDNSCPPQSTRMIERARPQNAKACLIDSFFPLCYNSAVPRQDAILVVVRKDMGSS